MTVSSGKRRQPSLAQLRAFAAVAEHLHFRDAAAAIGMSQPALSGAVSALEEILGVTLLERTTRKVLLSPAGERLAVRAKAVLDEVSALLEEAEAVRAPFTGALRLGVIPTVAPYLLPTVLRLVHERYPHLDLQVHEEQTASLVDGLHSGRLDLLLLAVPLGVPGVTELPLFDEDFVLVTPLDHELGGREGIPREALRELNLLLLDEGHCLRDQALEICREAGRQFKGAGRGPSAEGGGGRRVGAPVTTTAAGLSTLVQLVAGGLGCTLLPRTAVKVETTRSSELRTGSFADPAPSRRIALAMRAGAARGAEYRELAAALRESMRPLPVRVLDDAS
ncbi:LysR substrate-binding domain-containing protein [Streptomyces sp. NBC_00820]|uniref:LysR substrate-binding domain-containing protein n=1 Tax=Streptomyces sp. NBC_00820 TaxID=2975842 RepID=UPI002ED4795F|nr:LysR substrate-binding domain-containing protein [Streptomyces sp. NBC_00820]